MKNIFIIIILFPLTLLSQDFEKEDFVFLMRKEHIDIRVNDGNFTIIKSFSQRGKFLTAKKLYYANESLSFDSFSAIKDIQAFTYLPEERKKFKSIISKLKEFLIMEFFTVIKNQKTSPFPL